MQEKPSHHTELQVTFESTGFLSPSFAGELAHSPWLYISFKATFNYPGFTSEPYLWTDQILTGAFIQIAGKHSQQDMLIIVCSYSESCFLLMKLARKLPFPHEHVKQSQNKQPGTFQTPKLYTCQVSSKTSLSFLLVLKFCTKGEILFEVSSRTPIEVNGLGFLPKGKDEDNQRKNTSAKCPVLARPLQDFKTRQKLVFPCS